MPRVQEDARLWNRATVVQVKPFVGSDAPSTNNLNKF